ncbi:unnamed protein product [Trichogramma brassicae]|uniref:Uncharacterized protein n=1 Tax=Trichogramma brassicae TaxID=86971 RepID=A0A6H5IDN2_9HYME|nr:unnamed protein product [Trichogramma brassicae]
MIVIIVITIIAKHCIIRITTQKQNISDCNEESENLIVRCRMCFGNDHCDGALLNVYDARTLFYEAHIKSVQIHPYTKTMHITHSLAPEGLYIYYMESLGIASVILPRQSLDGAATRGRKLASIRCCVQYVLGKIIHTRYITHIKEEEACSRKSSKPYYARVRAKRPSLAKPSRGVQCSTGDVGGGRLESCLLIRRSSRPRRVTSIRAVLLGNALILSTLTGTPGIAKKISVSRIRSNAYLEQKSKEKNTREESKSSYTRIYMHLRWIITNMRTVYRKKKICADIRRYRDMRRLGVQGLIFFQLGEPPILYDAIVDCRIPFFRAVCCVVTHCWHLLLSWTSSFRTRCLVPSCECGSRFCRRWQVPQLLCRLHLVSVVLASGATL